MARFKRVLTKQKFKEALMLEDPNVLNEIGDFVVKRIQGFTRSGLSIFTDKPTKLKALSFGYINQRRKSGLSGLDDFQVHQVLDY